MAPFLVLAYVFVSANRQMHECKRARKQTSVCLFINRYLFRSFWNESPRYLFLVDVRCLSFECTFSVCNRMWIDWNFKMIAGPRQWQTMLLLLLLLYAFGLVVCSSTGFKWMYAYRFKNGETSLWVSVYQQANINKPENWYLTVNWLYRHSLILNQYCCLAVFPSKASCECLISYESYAHMYVHCAKYIITTAWRTIGHKLITDKN